MINRVTIKTKAGEGKEVAYDRGVSDARIDEDTDFDPEKPSMTRTLSLQIPVFPNPFDSNYRKLVARYRLLYST